jgi:hypothetical protein
MAGKAGCAGRSLLPSITEISILCEDRELDLCEGGDTGADTIGFSPKVCGALAGDPEAGGLLRKLPPTVIFWTPLRASDSAPRFDVW